MTWTSAKVLTLHIHCRWLMTSGLDRRKQSFWGATPQITEWSAAEEVRDAPYPTTNGELHKSQAQRKIESEEADFLILPLNVSCNPVVHEGGRRNIMLLDDYIAPVLCGVLDTQWVSHNMSDVWPGKHKVVGCRFEPTRGDPSVITCSGWKSITLQAQIQAVCVYFVVFIKCIGNWRMKEIQCRAGWHDWYTVQQQKL